MLEWNDSIKNMIRNEKISFLSQKNPTCLTLPGNRAIFERKLVYELGVNPNNIIGVQKPIGCSDIIETLSGNVPHGMRLFIGRLDKFVNVHADLEQYRLYKKISSLLQYEPSDMQFSLFDLDFCGAFSNYNFDAIKNIWRYGLAKNSGSMFIVHIKGRERITPHIPTAILKRFPMANDDLRVRKIPLSYILQAKKHNYNLCLHKIHEYRSKKMIMIQYYFKFSKKISNSYENLLRNVIEEHNRAGRTPCVGKFYSLTI